MLITLLEFIVLAGLLYLIRGFFNYSSTNASAESFNPKIKDFRIQFRGVKDIPFIMFRLYKLYA